MTCEYTYGRTTKRWIDWAAKYNADKRTIQKAIEYRLRKELDCRERWPMYASYEEDAKLRNPKWNDHFDAKDGPRVVMHDTTDIELPKPSAGDLNRATHNRCCNGTCAKGGIAVQLCNWTYGLPLVTGHCDDDQQIKFTKILELQKFFAENDPTLLEAFLNVFDKGRHKILDAKQLGQLCLQPDVNDGMLSSGCSVLRTGCVAVVRSGNERGVKRGKLSWVVKDGMKHRLMPVDLLCDVWETWTFRTNFMYQHFQ